MAIAKECGKIEHCCWLGGTVCKYLGTQTGLGLEKKFVCSLKLVNPTWEDVYKTQEYINDVKPKLEKIRPGMDCNDFPFKGEKCHACGSIGE